MSALPLLILGSYLLGCFTTGYYLVRLTTGGDIRTVSSGNAGSRNVGRVLGARGFILTLAGDAGKGLLAVWLARQFSTEMWVAQLALIAAVSGHIWPVQLGLRGGKGFATFAGGTALLQPMLLTAGLLLCLLLYPLLRGTTKTALVVLAASPLLPALFSWYAGAPIDKTEIALYCLLVGIVLYAHRPNIVKEFGVCFAKGE